MRLRMLEDQPTKQVCQALQISEDNLFRAPALGAPRQLLS
jgi:hypothetical protein